MRDKRTYKDRARYLIEAVRKRRKKLKILAIEYKGGKCALCGYNRCPAAMDFHHLVPSDKGFALSDKGRTRSWEKLKAELDKTVLLCANCHREVEDGQTDLTGTMQVRPLPSQPVL